MRRAGPYSDEYFARPHDRCDQVRLGRGAFTARPAIVRVHDKNANLEPASSLGLNPREGSVLEAVRQGEANRATANVLDEFGRQLRVEMSWLARRRNGRFRKILRLFARRFPLTALCRFGTANDGGMVRFELNGSISRGRPVFDFDDQAAGEKADAGFSAKRAEGKRQGVDRHSTQPQSPLAHAENAVAARGEPKPSPHGPRGHGLRVMARDGIADQPRSASMGQPLRRNRPARTES